ncbi:ATP-binding cassette domain-containing protein [Streptomyces spectabilis]|uniref:ABC transporter ATP-binding protein n=1 Tax=Streptomyces spectabilis TaxID=68270 RepID=A0A5P2XH89_STRST|nr:ABC transporter ATP-binding protein [Streptomyces spectabilis]MBB5102028.1 ATP-binding cassette subfamily C protein [Streptomyces spectabilis]MCI3907079.1 ABC transporter ATP-binding protein/permease [Streptomyces spectabilis]QEV63848.1 ABC transporter ATP-binding protein [Streptomyces spectabilis]GGV35768.1 ABC transporter ATP-binding protein [Streptomyces spectabilis]
MNGTGRTLLLSVVRERRSTLAWILLWSIVETAPVGVSGLLIATAIDHFLSHDVPPATVALAALLVAALVGAVATRRLFPLMAAVIEPVRDAFVTALVEGVLTDAVRSARPPDLASVARLTQQVQTVREVLHAGLRIVRQIVFASVAALVGLSLLAPLVALISGGLVLAALALFAWLLPGLTARHKAVLLAEEEVAQRAGTAFSGVRDAIACAGEQRVIADVDRAVDEQRRRARALARATSARTLVVFVGGQLPVLVLLAAAPSLLRHGYVSLGELAGAVAYLTVGLEPALRRLLEVMATWGLEMAVSVTRLGETFAEPGESPGTGLVPDAYDLRIEGLTFAYGPHATPVVQDLGFAVPEGSHLAIVGPSGIGKSTLAGLLTGLLTARHGRVLLGGADLGGIDPRELRRHMALIPQEAYVFTGTLRENLIYLAPRATEAEIARALAAVGLRAVADRLGGIDARVGAGGAELSQGERQLVSLARVYLSPARLVILDEATSELDPEAEAKAEAAFARRTGTLIVIAHRISSAHRADQVLLLDGDTAHLGTHDQLAAASPLYADLVCHWDHERGRPLTPSGNRLAPSSNRLTPSGNRGDKDADT